MASALTDKLSRLVKHISGQARITESNVADMLREVRMALLEADVALPVVRDFIARVKEKALGQEVIGSLQPGQALVAIVNKELAATMGEGVSDLNLAAQPPAVILMCWPSLRPSLRKVTEPIHAALSHVSFVIGSGASWSHALFV